MCVRAAPPPLKEMYAATSKEEGNSLQPGSSVVILVADSRVLPGRPPGPPATPLWKAEAVDSGLRLPCGTSVSESPPPPPF